MINSLSILGSTGSIGTQTLDVVDKLNLKVSALTASTNIKLLEDQVRKYKPELAVVFDEEKAKELKENEMKSKLILQVHDELIVEAVDSEIDIVKKIVKDEMENAVCLDVNLDVDLNIGDSWYDTK